MAFPKLYEERVMRVFVAFGGKRFFVREAARRRGAWDLIKQHCKCYMHDDTGQLVSCKYHGCFYSDDPSGDGFDPAHLGRNLHGKLVRRSLREEARKRKAQKGGK